MSSDLLGVNKDPTTGIFRVWQPIDGLLFFRAQISEKYFLNVNVNSFGKKSLAKTLSVKDFSKAERDFLIAQGCGYIKKEGGGRPSAMLSAESALFLIGNRKCQTPEEVSKKNADLLEFKEVISRVWIVPEETPERGK